jgi:D-amino-acid dehydrogenase
MASFGDFDGDDYKPDPYRQRLQLEMAEKILNKKLDISELNPWCGLRAYTPDELPLIGRLKKFENLYLATGHASRGIANSFGSSLLLTE